MLPDYQTPWLTNLLEEGTQKLIFFFEENGAPALQKVKSNGKKGEGGGWKGSREGKKERKKRQ